MRITVVNKDEIESTQATTMGEYFQSSTRQMISVYKMQMSPIKQNFWDKELSAGPGREALGQGLPMHGGLGYIPALQRQKLLGHLQSASA